MGKVRAARELRSRGIQLSPSRVHAIWKQNVSRAATQRLMSRRREGRSEKASLSDSQRALLQRVRVSRRLIGSAAPAVEPRTGASSSSPRRRA